MNYKKLLKTTGKNALAIIIGTITGSIIAITYSLNIWLPANSATLGLKAIPLIPVIIIFSIITGSIIGAITSLIIKLTIHRLKKKK